jgi:hypothetical protein
MASNIIIQLREHGCMPDWDDEDVPRVHRVDIHERRT